MLRLGLECEKKNGQEIDLQKDIIVYVNSYKVEFVEMQGCGEPQLTESPIYVFEIPQAAIGTLVQTAEIYGNINFTICYADVTIIAKEEEEK